MLTRIKNLLRKSNGVLATLLICTIMLGVVYLAVNVIHFTWRFVRPEGFWSFFKFTTTLAALVFIVGFLCIVIFGLVSALGSALSNFPKSITKKNLLNFLLFLGCIAIIIPLNFIQGSGLSYYLYKKMADKYSYLHKSEEFFDEGYYEKALQEAEKSYNKEHTSEDVSSFFIITSFYQKTSFYKEDRVNRMYASTINYGSCLKQAGKDLEKARELFQAALALSSQIKSDTKENYQNYPLMQLSELHLSSGEYAKSEKYYNMLLHNVSQHGLQEDEQSYFMETEEIIGSYYLTIGDFDKADKIFDLALYEYDKSELNKKSTDYLALLLISSAIKMRQSDIKETGRLLLLAQPIAEKKRKKDIYLSFLLAKANYCLRADTTVPVSLLNRSWLRKISIYFGKYSNISEEIIQEGKGCLLEYYDECLSRHGENHFTVANSLAYLGSFYSKTQNFREADSLFIEALKILNSQKADYKDIYTNILLQKTVNDVYLGFNGKVGNEVQELEDLLFGKALNTLLFQTEDGKESYITSIDRQIRILNSLRISLVSDQSGKIYNNILTIKNLVLSSDLQLKDFIRQSGRQSTYENLSIRKRDLEDQKLHVEDKSEYRKLLMAQESIEIEERKFIQALITRPDFSSFNPRAKTWIDIKSVLKSNQVAIEILDAPLHPYSQDSSRYYAFILANNIGEPKLVPLFYEKDLAALLENNSSTLDKVNNLYVTNKKKIYDMIWKPIDVELPTNTADITISLTGILHSVSFAAFVDRNLQIVGSTRELVDNQRVYTYPSEAALFGDIKYCSNSELKFTKIEVDSIAHLLSVSGTTLNLFTKKMATKSAFRKLNGTNINLLHIATHGFFQSTKNRFLNQNFSSIDQDEFDLKINPLSRSGLIFAGLDNTDPSDCDEILTAYELSKLNLKNLDLAVLSACETGLGEVRGSEGVFGFYRALKLAGAKATIVSLWNVPDKSTSELMISFYRHYLNGVAPNKALYAAQEDIKKRYNSPYYWAGFMLIE